MALMFSWIGDHFFGIVLAAVAVFVAHRAFKWLMRSSPQVPKGYCNKCGWLGPLTGGKKACGRCGSIKLTMRTS